MDDPEETGSYLDAPRILHPPPGPRSRELLAEQARWETDAVAYSHYFPIAVRSARGATIEDVDGNRFIDWVAGISVLNLGHRHPRLTAALDAQSREVWHALELPTEARIRFLKELEASLPGTLRNNARIFFTVTGGDAIETAVQLADFAQQRHGTVTFSGAYHGVHGGAVRPDERPPIPRDQPLRRRGGRAGAVPGPVPSGPRGRRGGRRHHRLPRAPGERPLLRRRQRLGRRWSSRSSARAATSSRPTTSCRRCASSATATGSSSSPTRSRPASARTGRMWAVEHARVTPDILCIAKTIGGGIPLSRGRLPGRPRRRAPAGLPPRDLPGQPARARRRNRGPEGPPRGRPDLTRRPDAAPRSMERFRDLGERHPSIGDVRGKGFMVGVEFVQDRKSPERLGRPREGDAIGPASPGASSCTRAAPGTRCSGSWPRSSSRTSSSRRA